MNQHELSEGMVNFVCPTCQKIYYKESMDTFNNNQSKVTYAAKVAKNKYHKCNQRRNKR